MSSRCHPDCQRAAAAKEEDDSAERAATVAANLISSARLILKRDSEFTEYSAQYLVDNALVVKEPVQQGPPRSTFTIADCLEHLVDVASPKTEADLEEMAKQQQRRSKITVKDCLECAFKEGIPRRQHWAHLGCVSKVPPYASLMPRVPMKGEVIEVKKLEDALKLLKHGPGVYQGLAGAETRYVGLRDVIIGGVDKVNGVEVATVKICYKKRTSLMKVALNRIIMLLQHHADESQSVEPTHLLVDFIVPRLFK
ncbi:protein HEAT-INDUCED TAS1 TARGET 4 isoform X4 [Brassica rapa]|uniref:protein HEAT-INDUCED TAS1 TARGET 4 isoform X4 n=1 Tax=Brassica campestris TaxID=3711 RepID=UPI00142D2C78|nr:protein HEAT-INDUCED TAS1 TARGET 4 isoform X4 [Brassica rapa]